MEGLIESINRLGLINPISVKEDNGQYILIAGYNRILALHQLGKKTAPAFVYSGNDVPIQTINISENLHRGVTNPMDEAQAISDLKLNTNSTLAQIATMLGRSENWVTGRFALLCLPDDLQSDLSNKRLSIAVCQQLAYVEDTNLRRQLATRAIDYGASANVVKQWVDQLLGSNLPNNARVIQMGTALLKDKNPDLTLDCLACTNPHPPENLTSELICSECKKLLSGPAAPETTTAESQGSQGST